MRYVFVAASLLHVGLAQAQTDGILQLNDPVHRFLERQWTLGNLGVSTFLTHQPLSLPEARAYLDSLDAHARTDMTGHDRILLDRHRGTDPAPGARWIQDRIGGIYRNGTDLAEFRGDGYSIQVNPLLYLSYGLAKQSARPDRKESIAVWQNTRGIRLSGHIGSHVFFETRFEENQVKLPDLAGPASGDRRGFAYRDGDNTFDYGIATGVIGFRSRYFEARFGQDRHRWPSTNGSLILSNYSPPFAFLQLRTTVGPFQYTNLFASLQDARTPRAEGELIKPFKYGAFHRLAFQPNDRIELGLFESVILAPTDDELDPGFFFTFLNPVVLLHTLNLDAGSPGNVVFGLDGRWRIRDGLAIDGQFFVDDLEVDQFFSNADYWKNTYGLQLGVTTADLVLADLDVRLEYTRVRPYSYSNRTAPLSYTNRNGVLGFPIGPNTEDVAVFVRYRLGSRLTAALNASFGSRGRNDAGTNFGSDPFVPYDDNRPGDDGIKLLQGVQQDIIFLEGHFGYELLPHLFVDAVLRYESIDDGELGLDRYVSPQVALRWGLPFQSGRY